MNETSLALIVMTVTILLPLIPAVVLFRFLSSSADAEGPVHGLRVRLGGPIAAYTVLFLCLLYVRPQADVHFHTWTVSGVLNFDHLPTEDEPNVNDVMIRFVPPRLNVMNEGAFTWEIPVIERDGTLQFPDLQIDLRNFRGQTIPLGIERPYGSTTAIKHDMKTRRITLTEPLVMKSHAAGRRYAPTAPAQEIK